MNDSIWNYIVSFFMGIVMAVLLVYVEVKSTLKKFNEDWGLGRNRQGITRTTKHKT